jgi:HSP20 family protein
MFYLCERRRSAVSDSQKSGLHVFTIRYPYVTFEQCSWQPALNIYETGQAVIIVAELAGVDPRELQIDVEVNLVRIAGMRQMTPPPGLQRIERMEIPSCPFRVEIPLRVAIDTEQADSRYQHGLLEVVLPFARRTPQRVIISVTEGGQE